MLKQIHNFIDNKWCPPAGGQFLDNYNPATGEVVSALADSDARDIEQAVSVAMHAFKSYGHTTFEERAQLLYRLADLIEKNAEELARLESEDQGKPYSLAKSLDIPRAVANCRFFAGAIVQQENESYVMDSQTVNYVLRKPVGVVALISPWNLPLYILTWKLAPAIACGNTVICKPSEFTSMTAARLCDLVVEAGYPAGVVNMVFGTGGRVGDALVRHQNVARVSFTGGTETGKKIALVAAEQLKKVSLELGGKNPNIIFADCEYEQMLKMTLRSSFLNQGEICLCGSRIYVEESLYPRFVKDFVAETEKLICGDPADRRTFMGALVSQAHFEKVKSFIALAKSEGGRILTGGVSPDLPDRFKKGYFLRPTIIEGLPETSACVQKEIFGPVVTVSSFKTLPEVIDKANAVAYGLSASAWTQNLKTAQILAQKLETGTLWVNTWMKRDLRAPFGGVKASGLGREGGKYSFDFFTETVTVCLSQ